MVTQVLTMGPGGPCGPSPPFRPDGPCERGRERVRFNSLMNAVLQNLSKWHLSFSVCLNVFVPIYGRCLYYMSLRNTAQSVY